MGKSFSPLSCKKNQSRLLRFPGRYLSALICALLVISACSMSDHDSGMGGITFTLNPQVEEAAAVQYKAPDKATDFLCEQYDIVTVKAEVLDSRGNLIAAGGPWDCAAKQGTIPYIKAGSNYTLNVWLINSGGNVRWQGSEGGLRVLMGRITNTDVILHKINFTPVFEEVDSQQVRAGQNLSFTISATDPDGDPITYIAVSLPPGASFNSGTGLFSWTPGVNDVGEYTLEFQAIDNYQDTPDESLFISIRVTDPNNPPFFEDIGNKYVRAGQNLSFTISATDPEGDPITYIAVSLPPGASFNPDKALFFWKPGNNTIGTYTAQFKVIDNYQITPGEFLYVDIIVTGPNKPPVFVPMGNHQVAEGSDLHFTLNVVDPDGDAITCSALSLPAGAAFNQVSRAFSWTPSFDQAGTYTARFEATDSSNPPQSTLLEVTIVVNNTNRCPVLNVPAEIQQVTPGDTLEFSVTATDPDGDAFTIWAADLPQNSSGAYFPNVSFDPTTGTFRWESPDIDALGEYNVLFIVADNGTPSCRIYQTVTIEVYDNPDDIRRYPILQEIGSKHVNPGDTLQFTVSATDPDYGDGGLDILEFTIELIASQPYPVGCDFNPITRQFSWLPQTPGNFWIRFIVTDPGDYPLDLFDSEDVVITVGNVNRPPVLEPIGRRVFWYGETLQFTIYATDPDGNELTYSATNLSAATLPKGATFDPQTHTFTWDSNLLYTKSLGTRCILPLKQTIRFMVTDSGTPQESDYEDVEITLIFE
jgi:hypothetical protein